MDKEQLLKIPKEQKRRIERQNPEAEEEAANSDDSDAMMAVDGKGERESYCFVWLTPRGRFGDDRQMDDDEDARLGCC